MIKVAIGVLTAGFAAGAGLMVSSSDDGIYQPTSRPGLIELGMQPSFANWENHPIHGLEITPDGSRLLVTNTPDNRLEVFDLTSGVPEHIGSVPVGLDPVSVRARTSTEAWVANHISDTISIVDLASMTVIQSIQTDDEPFDIAFAGAPQKAFVTCSQVNLVQVFDIATGTLLDEIEIKGEDPRAIEVSPDGSRVYVAVFESGNGTTILGGGIDPNVAGTLAFPPNVVSDPLGPYAGQNPPPNAGAGFDPPVANGTLPVGLIVRKDENGRWMDDNGGDWTDFVSGSQAARSGRVVGWDMPDRDLAVIEANSGSVSYETRLMNICMGLGVNPATGEIAMVGTEAINEVRFEPNVNGIFVRSHLALVDGGPGADTIIDLNPHLDYSTPNVSQSERDKSIGDPRDIVFSADGSRAYICGMGSNNVVVVDAAGARAGLSDTIEVGEGPTSLAIDDARGNLYVLNRFDGSLSVVDLISETEIERVSMFDPSPEAIKVGRKHFYDTHETSGLGQTSCASCHVDGRMDRLAWDLGDPSGAFKNLNGLNLGAGVPGLNTGFLPFHPMKGPMTTQTFQGIIGMEPFHWRGDRLGLEEFNPAFVGLLGDDEQLSPQAMQEFEDFVETIFFPPNPFRNQNNTLPASLETGQVSGGRFSPAGTPLPPGRPNAGMTLYRSTTRLLDGGLACVTCHTLPTGAGPDMRLNLGTGTFVPIAPGPNGEHHIAVVSVDGSTNRTIKIPQLRNGYEKTGFDMTSTESLHGFGVLHDGSVDTLARFVSEPAFSVVSDQEVADLVAFMLCLSGSDLPQGSPTNVLIPPGPPSADTHAGVGVQETLNDIATAPVSQTVQLTIMETLAGSGDVGLVVKGRVGGEQRGYVYDAGEYQSDRSSERLTPAALKALATPGAPLTFTMVPLGTETRIGIDRDEDGHFDTDETDRCTDPADPESYPGAPGTPDCDPSTGPGVLDIFDFLCFQDAFVQGDPYADCDGSTVLDIFDFLCFQDVFVQGCQ